MRRIEQSKAVFLAESPGLAEALGVEHAILQDLAARLDRYGFLSPAQVALAHRLAAETRERQAELKAPAPEGKVTFRGRVVSVKTYDGPYRSTTLKMAVKVATPEGVWLAWGTAPSQCISDVQTYVEGVESGLRGCEVEVTATLRRGRDAHFAIMSRPRGRVLSRPATAAS
jgi:hypothetical protein